MTVASPTPTGVSALRDDRALAPRGPFAATWNFLRRQPVGAIGMFLVLAVRAGRHLRRRAGAVQPDRERLRGDDRAAELGASSRHRPARARPDVPHPVWRAHCFRCRADLGSGRRLRRPDPRRRERLFRRPHRSVAAALYRHLHGVSADHHGAGRRVDLRHRRRKRDRRDHNPADPALRPCRSFERAGDPRDSLCRCGARPRLWTYQDHSAPHGAECDGAVPRHRDRVCRPGDPGRGRRCPIWVSACRSRCRPGG